MHRTVVSKTNVSPKWDASLTKLMLHCPFLCTKLPTTGYTYTQVTEGIDHQPVQDGQQVASMHLASGTSTVNTTCRVTRMASQC